MIEINAKRMINGIGNDLKIAVDDLIGVILMIKEDVENLKVKTLKPDKPTAEVLLEYIAIEDCKEKKNIEILCGDEIKRYFRWIDTYCEENGITSEQVLNEIIKGEI